MLSCGEQIELLRAILVFVGGVCPESELPMMRGMAMPAEHEQVVVSERKFWVQPTRLEMVDVEPHTGCSARPAIFASPLRAQKRSVSRLLPLPTAVEVKPIEDVASIHTPTLLACAKRGRLPNLYRKLPASSNAKTYRHIESSTVQWSSSHAVRRRLPASVRIREQENAQRARFLDRAFYFRELFSSSATPEVNS